MWFYRFLRLALTACLFYATPASAGEEQKEWLPIRVVIYESILENDDSGCARQHLGEHIYARSMHDALDKTIENPYTIHAFSSMDKIIISIDVFADPAALKEITRKIAAGLENRPSMAHIASEAILYFYEEKLLREKPVRAQEILSNLSVYNGLSLHETCSPAHYWNDPNYYAKKEPPDYVIYSFVDEKVAILSSKIQISPIDLPNIFNAAKLTISDETTQSHAGEGMYLLILFDGTLRAINLIETVAGIYRSAIALRVKPFKVRPFGRGALIVDASSADIDRLYDHLNKQKDFFESASVIESAIFGEMARAFVCTMPTRKKQDLMTWADLMTMSPYFEFSVYDDVCSSGETLKKLIAKEGLSKIKDVKPIVVKKQAEKQQNDGKVGDKPNIRFNLCFPRATHTNELLGNDEMMKIFGSALRQYLRMDAGLLLNASLTQGKGDCAIFAIVAPASNGKALSDALNSFDPASPKFQRRLLSSFMKRRCTHGADDNSISCTPDKTELDHMNHLLEETFQSRSFRVVEID